VRRMPGKRGAPGADRYGGYEGGSTGQYGRACQNNQSQQTKSGGHALAIMNTVTPDGAAEPKKKTEVGSNLGQGRKTGFLEVPQGYWGGQADENQQPQNVKAGGMRTVKREDGKRQR